MLGPHCLDGSQPNHGGVSRRTLVSLSVRGRFYWVSSHKALVRSQWGNPDKVDYDFHGK